MIQPAKIDPMDGALDAIAAEADAATLIYFFQQGETDMRERVIRLLKKFEGSERQNMRAGISLEKRRIHRERADIIKGAIGMISAFPLTGPEIE